MTDISPSRTQKSQKEMTGFDKIIHLFLSPRQAFESIDRKPDWLAPMIIIVIVSVFFTTLIMPIALPTQLEKQRTKMEQRGMSENEINNAMEIAAKFGKIMVIIMSGIMPILMLLLIAVLFMFMGKILFGGNTSFDKLLSVVSYSSLIGSLNSLIILPIILSKKTMEVHFSAATLLSNDAAETFLYQFLKKIDLFAIWEIIVLSIGASVVYKITIKKSSVMVTSLYALYMVISLAWFSLSR